MSNNSPQRSVSQHTRADGSAQTANRLGGKFDDKPGAGDGAAAADVFEESTYESPEVEATLSLQRWDYRDNLHTDREETVNLSAVFDGYSLDELPESADDDGGLDRFFYDAVRAGLVDEHRGPFSVDMDEDEYQEYLEARKAADKQERVSKLPLSPEVRDREVSDALASALPDDGVISVMNWKDGTEAREWARWATTQISGRLDRVGIEPEEADGPEAGVILNIRAVSQADDDVVKAPTYLKSVQRQAIILGDRIIQHSLDKRR